MGLGRPDLAGAASHLGGGVRGDPGSCDTPDASQAAVGYRSAKAYGSSGGSDQANRRLWERLVSRKPVPPVATACAPTSGSCDRPITSFRACRYRSGIAYRRS